LWLGYAERPTAAIATETMTAAPIPAKRLRGRVRPGSRVSAARFATVSRPVYASMASGSENAIADQVGAVPRSRPRPSASLESRNEKPSRIRSR
jgi:hypothetical protein